MIRKILLLPFAFLIALFSSCGSSPQDENMVEKSKVETFKDSDYSLHIPTKADHLLVLFPCYPCDAENTLKEWNVLEEAMKNDVAVLAMNFNFHLWLEEKEKVVLANLLNRVIEKHKLSKDNVVIGGFSGGGNVALLMTDYLHEIKHAIAPKGVFIADSPIDLLALYDVTGRVVDRQQSEVAVEEALWIRSDFHSRWGEGKDLQTEIEKRSPYTSKNRSIKNLSHLKDVSIRLYTEPDTTWWKTNRGALPEEMNSFFIKKLAEDLSDRYGKDQVELIETENRGYRSNGDRHPHSWSIIEEEKIVLWQKILPKKR